MMTQATPIKTYHIPERVRREIIAFAKKHKIDQVILFGSRARGDHTERSDIDLAVGGGDVDAFRTDICEESHTLLSFDVVDLNGHISEELKQIIAQEGVIMYEKTGELF